MNVLLLGNGFDLYYKLPTKYNNFLHTVDFLIKNEVSNLDNIGQVFGNENLQAEDEFIKESYEKYKSVYDKTLLDKDKMTELVNLTKDNIWFSYLLKSFNKDKGWIDFEKEISTVIFNLQEILSKSNITIVVPKSTGTGEAPYIFTSFDFYLMNKADVKYAAIGTRKVKPEYTIEYPFSSKNYIINKEKIIEELTDRLYEFAKALKHYLQCFVDSIVDELRKENLIEKCKAFSNTHHIVTFNYTNTYEKIYLSESNVYHLHGNINDEIVLGINPDSFDDKETVDTSFIYFKKYFQRATYETDSEYLKWIQNVKDKEFEISLLVMGHSLDITDEDIISDLFSIAKDITIIYHNIEAKMQYISNLVRIFGRGEFEKLRYDKKLTFLPLDMDFTEFAKQRADKALEDLIKVYTY